jgi:methionyl aminopeptidase
MVFVRNKDEIECLRKSNLLVSSALVEVSKLIKPGITTDKLDAVAEEFIRDHGAVPGFLGYSGFPKTLCTSVNEQVVHGIPSNYKLMDGDIISIDCGVILNGFYGDSAYTFKVGEVDAETKNLLKVTKDSLYQGIEQAITGKRVGDISFAVQSHAEKNGYSIVRELVGHGLGKKLHEPPEVPNFGRRGRGALLKKGLVICIEPMINMGKKNVITEKDGWTIRTADKKPSAHFEHAVAINDEKADILSSFEMLDKMDN